MEFDMHVSPKFGGDHTDVSTKEIVKFQVEDELFKSQHKRENRRMISQSHSISCKEINDFIISHDLETEEEDSVEDPNIAGIPELTFQSQDAKVESDSRLPFSRSSSSSLCFS
ncbi:UNVERIFIED_CONTAM: hypothetical protein RMT77_010631 [Armadillidium vulgare]